MNRFFNPRVMLGAAVCMLVACSSTRKQDSANAPSSSDLLELLTGFGESLSKRNFVRAVDYMVPEEKAMMMENGSVPPEKQKALLALPLQRLIRHPAIRVEHGKIAGIYTVLPNLSQNSGLASTEGLDAPIADPAAPPAEGTADATLGADDGTAAPAEGMTAVEPSPDLTGAPSDDPKLRETVNKFFSHVNRKNWSAALALMSEGEKKLLLDDKGRLKESSKQRLSHIDQKNKEALVLQNGKLMGVTLLLPSD